jgi:hypothetical protein
MRVPNPCKLSLTFLLLIFLFLPLTLISAPESRAQPLNEFFEIYSPDPGAYDMYQMKFTYLGPQKKAVSSLAIVGPARPFDLMLFMPWHVDYDYSNDDFMGEIIMVPGPEWQLFMDMISMDPALQSTARIPDPTCSVMIQTDMPMPMCWEHPATVMETDLLFQLLEDSIMDPAQKEIIARFRRQMAGVRR